MSEKTSEEKLREELEGNSLTGESLHSSSDDREKSSSSSSRLRRVRRRVSSGTDKSIGQRVDSFIDEFEKRIEESLAGGNAKTQTSSSLSRQDKPRLSRKSQTDKTEVKEAAAESKAPVNLPLDFRKPDTPHEKNHEEQTAIVQNTHASKKSEETVQTENVNNIAHEVINEPEYEPDPENISPVESVNDVPQVIPEQEPENISQPESVNDVPQVTSESEDISQAESVNDVTQVISEPENISQSESVNDVMQVIPEPKDISQVESVNDIPQVIPEIEHEEEPVIDDPEDVNEALSPEPEPEDTEYHELPDIPLIESDDEQKEELPDIPVISADDVEDSDDEEELEEFEDIPVIDAEIENEGETESQESESESESETEPEEYDSDMAIADNADTEESGELKEETPEEFLPSADIVVNVDSDLPQIVDEPEPEPEPDPEAEAVPVSVTMPETTKTAEDKLMADIAEAMTGNPLTLESKESPEPYRLPENFYTSQNTDNNSEQSAEDKLKANIVQAMSESPLGIAQQQAMQDLEKDLNPFDDISSLADLAERNSPRFTESESESESEQEDEINGKDEEFLPDFTADPEEIHDIPESESENESESEDDDSSPFDVDINADDEPEEPEINLNELPFGDDVNDDVNDEEPVIESDAELEVEDVPLPDSEPEAESESGQESEPLTAQQRLEQEIAQFTQNAPEEPEESMNDKDTQQEEVAPENKMPDSLLDENEHEQQLDDEIGDDWDINSLGIVSEAASIPDDEPEPEPEIEPSFVNETEETHKEKTMGIREKLAARKNGTSPKDSAAPKKTSTLTSTSSLGGGMLLPLLLFLLLIVGGLTLWQLYTLPDKLASVMAMNSSGETAGVFDSISGIESKPSYDYAIDFILDQNIAERMSQRGRDGWQVVGSRRTQDTTSGQYGYEIIFMRRISGR